jgi:hypothetical protein
MHLPTRRCTQMLTSVSQQHPLYRWLFQRQQQIAFPWYVSLIELAATITFVPMLFFSYGVYGLTWIYHVTEMLVNERHSGRADVLGLLPGGNFGLTSTVAVAVIDSQQGIEGMREKGIWIFRIVLSALLSIFIPPYAAFYFFVLAMVDHAQTPALVLTIAALTTSTIDQRASALLVAPVSYLLLQITSWVVLLIALAVVDPLPGGPLLFALAVTTVILARETLIGLLWGRTLRTFGVLEAELDAPTRKRL